MSSRQRTPCCWVSHNACWAPAPAVTLLFKQGDVKVLTAGCQFGQLWMTDVIGHVHCHSCRADTTVQLQQTPNTPFPCKPPPWKIATAVTAAAAALSASSNHVLCCCCLQQWLLSTLVPLHPACPPLSKEDCYQLAADP